MSFTRNQSGHVLVLTAMCMSILIGFLGLALDVGLLYRARQNVQIAADAAATAAALDYLYNGSTSSAQTAGRAASATNGFNNGTGGVSVTINMPPQSGPVQTGGYAEAIITEPNPTNFMSLFGFRKVTVGARAVAGTPTAGAACVWLMPSSGTVLTLQGSATISAPGCGIYVNSDSTDAVDVHDGGITVNAAFFDVVGNETPKHQTSPTPITPDVAPRTSPWGNLSGPSIPSGCTSTTAVTSVTTSNIANVNGSASNDVVCFTGAVTLNNGVNFQGSSSGVVYVFEDGVTVATGATVNFGTGSCSTTTPATCTTTSGALMEVAGTCSNCTLNQDSNSLLSIYAPTTGSYDGIAILQPSTNTNELQLQFGSSNETLDGYVYAPGAEVYLQDQGGGVVASGIVAATIDLRSTFSVPYDTANASTTLNRNVTLVE